MKHFFDNIDEQILRYYRNELPDNEEKLLLSWVNESPENKKYFQEQIFIADTLNQKHIQFDSNKGFQEFLEKTNKPTKSKVLKLLIPVAASIVIMFVIATIYLSKRDKINQQKLYTSHEPSTQISLSDSSQITLRYGAKLIVPEKFNKKQRIVEFKGQAYFNITHIKKNNFKIIVDNITIEVMGTSFEIKTDSVVNNVEIRVESGKVKVFNNKTNSTFILQKDEQLIVNQQTNYSKRSKLKNNNYLAWKTKKLVFHSVKMEDVVIELMELYNKKIIFSDNSMKNCKVTFSVDNQSLDDVLLILQKLLMIEVFELGDKIVLAGNGCDNN